MQKLIEIRRENLIECDNCDYVIPFLEIDSKQFIDKPCPECRENLLTEKDYLLDLRLINTINWINKWFSWLSIFCRNKKENSIKIKVHNGINVK